jgi:hypothetical protein
MRLFATLFLLGLLSAFLLSGRSLGGLFLDFNRVTCGDFGQLIKSLHGSFRPLLIFLKLFRFLYLSKLVFVHQDILVVFLIAFGVLFEYLLLRGTFFLNDFLM